MYIRFTEEERRKACEADLVPLLLRNGEKVKCVGSEYMWMYGKEPVSIQGNLWFNHYEQHGGNTIDFVKRFYGLNYAEAVRFIIGDDVGEEIITKRDNRETVNRQNFTNCEKLKEEDKKIPQNFTDCEVLSRTNSDNYTNRENLEENPMRSAENYTKCEVEEFCDSRNYTNCEFSEKNRANESENFTNCEVFTLPPRNENMNRAFAYLMYTRGIDRKVLYPFSHAGLIYEDSKYHNIVFVGTDKNGKPRHAHKKGTAKNNHFRANHSGSNARFTFNWRGKSDKVYLFEAPIDLLSFIDLRGGKWSDDTYVAACSLSDKSLWQMLRDNPNLRQISICFDNDGPGQEAAKRLQKQLFTTGYHVEILVPENKDWNEDLLSLRQEEGEAECRTVSLSLS